MSLSIWEHPGAMLAVRILPELLSQHSTYVFTVVKRDGSSLTAITSHPSVSLVTADALEIAERLFGTPDDKVLSVLGAFMLGQDVPDDDPYLEEGIKRFAADDKRTWSREEPHVVIDLRRELVCYTPAPRSGDHLGHAPSLSMSREDAREMAVLMRAALDAFDEVAHKVQHIITEKAWE